MNGDSTLRTRYEQLLQRIRAACEACGRPPGSVGLLAVSKTFPAASVLEVAALGQRAFGESYLQEALGKIEACAAGRPAQHLEWHFIGPIQSNKTRSIAERFDWVHSVERERIAHRLSEQRPPEFSALNVCVQINVSGETTKSGCTPGEAVALARVVAGLPRLRLRGVMAIPEPTADAALQRARCAAVRAVFERMRTAGLDVDTLSMGMSDDMEAAIAEGSTLVRIGSALFGSRPAKVSARAADGVPAR